MSDIDKILRDTLQGHEVPYDSAMWDNVSSQLNPMEDAFRSSVENFEAPYNPGAWSAIKNQIGSTSTIIQWITGSAAALGLVAGSIALYPSNDTLVKGVHKSTVENNSSIVFNNEASTQNIINAIESELIENDNTLALNQNENSENISNNELPETFVNDEPLTNDNLSGTVLDVSNTNIEENTVDLDLVGNELDTDSPEITDNTPPSDIAQKYDSYFSISSFEICQGEKVLFNPKLTQRGITNVWSFGDGESSTESATTHTFTTPGEYEITHSLRDDKTNKIIASTKQLIEVHSTPEVDFSWEQDNEVLPTVDFNSESENIKNISWKVNGIMVSDKAEFEHTFREKGTYVIELSATNESGCSADNQQEIEIENDYNLLAPTAFTPNGDNINETFIPSALKLTDSEFTMTVFNQAGKTIFISNNANNPWDGSDNSDNSSAPNGAYIWTVQLKNGNGTVEYYTGQVFVTR